jgi:hypothetical protein
MFRKYHFEDCGIDGGTVLIPVLEKFGANVCTGLQCVRTGFVVEYCLH